MQNKLLNFFLIRKNDSHPDWKYIIKIVVGAYCIIGCITCLPPQFFMPHLIPWKGSTVSTQSYRGWPDRRSATMLHTANNTVCFHLFKIIDFPFKHLKITCLSVVLQYRNYKLITKIICFKWKFFIILIFNWINHTPVTRQKWNEQQGDIFLLLSYLNIYFLGHCRIKQVHQGSICC